MASQFLNMTSENSSGLSHLKIVSFNLHGFNQGCVTIEDLINDIEPDILLIQEHWLTPANLNKFDKFNKYFTFGCSAMSAAVESGLLKGRPFGGVMAMISKNYVKLLVMYHNYAFRAFVV